MTETIKKIKIGKISKWNNDLFVFKKKLFMLFSERVGFEPTV